MQVTQQIFVAEEWVKDARNQVKVEAYSRAEVEKSLEALKQEKAELTDKLVEAEKACSNAEAGLKIAERQAKKQRQQLHITDIDLATQKQLVMDLKAELQKVKEAAWVAREASEAAEAAFYERGMLETKIGLAEEVAGVSRDNCAETWAEALNRAGVPVDSELRRKKNVFFPEDIREVPTTLPPPVADPLPLPGQIPIIQAPIPHAEDLVGAGKVKKVQPTVKANQSKDDLTIKDVVFKTKDEKAKSKAGDALSKAVDSKNGLQQAKTQILDFSFCSFLCVFFFL